MTANTPPPLALSGAAYTSRHFDTVYNAHAERIGHRPAFTVLRSEGRMMVVTTEADRAAAEAIIAELEALTSTI